MPYANECMRFPSSLDDKKNGDVRMSENTTNNATHDEPRNLSTLSSLSESFSLMARPLSKCLRPTPL